MATTIQNASGSLSMERLKSIERKYNIDFPPEYRHFLLAYNGGQPQPSAFYFKHTNGSYSDSCVDWFLAIYDEDYSNFENYFDRYKGHLPRVPDELVPIAHDPGGNLICIAVKGENRGAIYFWDHEREEELPTYRNVHLVADSFNEFLESLTNLP
jgi:cell wall assembly regulator SMI1